MTKKITQRIIALMMMIAALSSTTSTLQAANVDIYTGVLSVDLSSITEEGSGPSVLVTPDQILLENKGDKINLTLKDFSFGPMYLGHIIINDIPVTATTEGSEFESEVIQLQLGGGIIEADVQVTGEIRGAKSEIVINVEWAGAKIPVTFVGDLVFDGLRLSDIKINNKAIQPTFNSDVFNYKGMIVSNGDKITYTKADPTSIVDVELDGNWVYLFVSKDGKRNKYTIADSGDLEAGIEPLPINKVEIGQNIDGNLLLRNRTEIVGNTTVAGTISYYKSIEQDEWNPIGLPYSLSDVKIISLNAGEVSVGGNWYSYNHKAEQVKLDGMNNVAMLQLGAMTADVIPILRFISKPGSSTKLDLPSEHQPGYNVLPNNSMETTTLSNLAVFDTYYMFNGTEFVQVAASTEIAPATMFIGYMGSTPLATIAAPNSDPSGIDGVAVDTANVYSANGRVYISNFTGIAKVYSLNGVNIQNTAVEGDINFELTSGVYIIQTEGKGKVVIVR